MSQNYGIQVPPPHAASPHRAPAYFLVLIEAGGEKIARLFLQNRELVSEFDAAVTEVVTMTSGLSPQLGALGPEWDQALQSHSQIERASAEVFTLSL